MPPEERHLRRAIAMLASAWHAALSEIFPDHDRAEIDEAVVAMIVPLAQSWASKPAWTWRVLPRVVAEVLAMTPEQVRASLDAERSVRH